MSKKVKFDITAKDKTGRAFDKVKKQLKSVKTAAGALSVATAGAVTSLVAIAKSAANTGDNLQKMSLRTGVSVKTLSGLAHAAKISGTDLSNVENGLRLVAKKALDADRGLLTARRSFEALGINVKDGAGNLKSADSIMLEVADKLKNMKDQTKAAALAQELFGRSGTQLLPMLKEGSAGIQALVTENERLGGSWEKAGADSAAGFNDAMARLIAVFSGLKNQIGQAIIPVLTLLAGKMTEISLKAVDWVKANQGLIDSKLKTFLVEALPSLKATAKAIFAIVKAIGTMIAAVAKVAGFFGTTSVQVEDTIKNIHHAVKYWLIDKFDETIKALKNKVKGILSPFKWLSDKLVGHSIIPDMMDKIEDEFGRIDDISKNLATGEFSTVLAEMSDKLTALDLQIQGLTASLKQVAPAAEKSGQKAVQSLSNMQTATKELADTMNSGFASAILSIKDGFGGLEDFAMSVIDNILTALIQANLVDPLVSSIRGFNFGGASGGGGAISALPNMTGFSVLGGKAAGGAFKRPDSAKQQTVSGRRPASH